ncbi:UNVERIFIED_CONTAM: hypothetical protein GTU68_060644 [Idotea baltica]|nr:hypothetical protein [Idotea baltica]
MEGSSSSSNSQFQTWKKGFGIKYETQLEERYRERIFLENLAKIEAHNANEYKTYKKGVNKFTDLTTEEFTQIYLGTTVSVESLSMEQSSDDISVGDVDWVSAGAVTDIKDQGQCGSCWAFSTTGSLEGLSFLSKGTLESFSEQQLVDCSYLKYGNLACSGGQMDNAFKYVKDKGIVHETQYPYIAKRQACQIPTG